MSIISAPFGEGHICHISLNFVEKACFGEKFPRNEISPKEFQNITFLIKLQTLGR